MGVVKYFRENWRKMIPFAIVGGVFSLIAEVGSGFIIGYFDVDRFPTFHICYIIATIVAYTLNTFFTFKTKFDFKNFITYFAIYMVAMGLATGFMILIGKFTSIPHAYHPIISAPLIYAWNYPMTNRFLKK